jgi:hypothetical protein
MVGCFDLIVSLIGYLEYMLSVMQSFGKLEKVLAFANKRHYTFGMIMYLK